MKKNHKVLVVDDQQVSLLRTVEVLSSRYTVITSQTASQALQLARDEMPSVIVLDLILPAAGGLLACEMLRNAEATRSIVIIVYTELNDPAERIRAFKVGADDYLLKPCDAEELLARVDAKIRRLEEIKANTEAQEIRCGNLIMDLQSLEARLNGKSVALTMLEFNLLKYFVEYKGKLRSRQQILEAVWRTPDIPGRILDPHILSIRKKIAGFDHQLSTIYGGGYILKEGTPIQSGDRS